MGVYVNPGNKGFAKDIAAEIYVDKTELLELINRRLGSRDVFFCNSRPRRFGKSMTINMLTAYYSKGCDSEALFAPFEIASKPSFLKHLNKYNLIRIDVQSAKGLAGNVNKLIDYLNKTIVAELQQEYSTIALKENCSLQQALITLHQQLGIEFIILLDEWDCIIRDDCKNLQAQKEYIDFLRGLFKGVEASEYICCAYMTGILPIKKYNTQSALNNFEEFTMLDAACFTKFVGFTESEVRSLCTSYGQDFAKVRLWYDGYLLGGQHIYNPQAVISLLSRKEFKSYWSQTGTYESILELLQLDFAGLKQCVIKMLAGEEVPADVRSFSNDMISFKSLDDVLTALIHLGYLGYNSREGTVFIPNEEIRSELELATKQQEWQEGRELMLASKELLEATWSLNNIKVAEIIESFHQKYASILQYNNENALSSVIGLAYIAAMEYYYAPIREMPAGKGFADIVYYPKREKHQLPALIIELKWNKNATAALKQIKTKGYTEALQGYAGRALLIGINYDKQSKEHTCLIEEVNL